MSRVYQPLVPQRVSARDHICRYWAALQIRASLQPGIQHVGEDVSGPKETSEPLQLLGGQPNSSCALRSGRGGLVDKTGFRKSTWMSQPRDREDLPPDT